MPSVEDRLLTLAVQAERAGLLALAEKGRSVEGDQKRARIVGDLTAQAPDLADEVRALCRALDCRVVTPGVDAVSLGIIVAAAEGMPVEKARAAAEVAVLATGGASLPPTLTPEELTRLTGGVFGPSPSPAPSPPPEPTINWQPPIQLPAQRQPWQEPLFFAIVAVLIVGGALIYFQPWAKSDEPPEHHGQFSADGPEIAPDGNLRPGGPTLSLDQNALPRLPVQRAASGTLGIGFSVGSPHGPVQGLVVLPANGWDSGEATLIGQRGEASSLGTGRFQRDQIDTQPMRILKPVWSKDELNAGPSCVMIGGQPGAPDVAPQGAKLCLADGACQRPIGCGMLP